MKIRFFASIYFALQGLAVAGWWILLFSIPASRKYFQMGDGETILLSFWLPDLFFMAIGSVVVSAFCFFNSKFLNIAVWFVVGATAYATVYCLSFALMTDSGWLGVVFMFPAMIWSGNFAIGLSVPFHKKMFRNSNEGKTIWILAKTFTQIVVIWGLILFVIPALIVRVETKLGIAQFTFPFQKIISAIMFLTLSFIGVWGAITMARIGRGTPLPLDSATKLVIAGVYSFVRNPMAISGIGQALTVGLFLGSPLVFAYALMGGMIWQLIFRPLEEEDLSKRFGADYEIYRENVRCWIPRRTRFNLEEK
jgi:protein-S-isoprenylcysteine O-methyltransferase Ste14